MDEETRKRLQQRMSDLQKKFEALGFIEEEEVVEDLPDGHAAIKQTQRPLGSQTDSKPEWSHIPLRGIRSFRLADRRKTLTGMAYPLPWEPGVNEAVCGYVAKYRKMVRSVNPFAGFPAPMRQFAGMGYDRPHPLSNCTHGFYSLLRRDHFQEMGGGSVHGMIEGWGEVIAGPDGFRCEKAKIVALVLPNAEGALGTAEEEEAKKNAPPEPEKKKKRDPLYPPRVVKFFYRHEGIDAISAVLALFLAGFLGVAAFQNMPWTLPLLLGVVPSIYVGWGAWAVSFSSKWGIGSPYWQKNRYPPQLMAFLNGDGRPGSDIDAEDSTFLAQKYGVPVYTSVTAMLENHPIERGEV